MKELNEKEVKAVSGAGGLPLPPSVNPPACGKGKYYDPGFIYGSKK